MATTEASLTIGDVARRFGLRTSALRYYEEVGLLRPARVRGRRTYGHEALTRLSFIRSAQGAGFSLSEIRSLLEGGGGWRALTQQKLGELETKIAELQTMQGVLTKALLCDCVKPETCERIPS